ncbi:MAG: sugar-binding protein [Polyangiales bacterium]
MGKARGWGCATAMCVALGGLGCGASSADDDVDEGVVRATQALGGTRHEATSIAAAMPLPLLDGERDAQYLHAEALPIARVVRGTPPAPGVLDARFRALHDSMFLYLFVEVGDDQVVVDGPPEIPWEDDSIEVFLDGDASAGEGYDGRDDVQLVLRPDDREARLGMRSAQVNVAAIGVATVRTPTGWRAEVFVPWSAIQATWRYGKTLGLDVHVNDDDDGGPRDRKVAWASTDDEAWQRPDRFGRVRLAAPRHRAARFQAVGDLPGGGVSSAVTALSASGGVAVGVSDGDEGLEAFRWAPGEGLTGLGSGPSRALSVSPSGSLVGGLATLPTTPIGAGSAGVWRADGTLDLLVGGPVFGGVPALRMVEPHVVRDDGRVFGTCSQYGLSYLMLACRQDGPEQLTLLTPATVIYAADDAGHVAGTRLPLRGEPIGSVAMLDGRELGHPTPRGCTLPHGCRSEVRAFSEGAKVAVGTAAVPVPPPEDTSTPPSGAGPFFEAAFVYTEEGGIVALPDLPGGEAASGAYAVSRDGRVIAGFGTDASGRHAVVWRDRVPAKLVDLVRESGSDVPDGWRLREVRGLSADGTTFAGNGTRPDGTPEGFWIAFPPRG